MIYSLIIAILVVGTAQSQNVYSVHNHLPLRIRFNDLNIVEELNTKFKNIDYMTAMFRDIYKSEYGVGFDILLSLGNNIIDLNDRLIYYKKVITILEEEKSLGIYEIIELIKEIKVILSDLNADKSTKVSAVILISNLTEKLENLSVNHLVKVFHIYKKYMKEGDSFGKSAIMENILELDRELYEHIYYKFGNVTYESMKNESTREMLRSFMRATTNFDSLSIFKVKHMDEMYPDLDNIIEFFVINELAKLPFSIKHKLEEKLLTKYNNMVNSYECIFNSCNSTLLP